MSAARSVPLAGGLSCGVSDAQSVARRDRFTAVAAGGGEENLGRFLRLDKKSRRAKARFLRPNKKSRQAAPRPRFLTLHLLLYGFRFVPFRVPDAHASLRLQLVQGCKPCGSCRSRRREASAGGKGLRGRQEGPGAAEAECGSGGSGTERGMRAEAQWWHDHEGGRNLLCSVF
eukprot:7377361-Prymnesium_polylepis.1